ncbi:hypothetical protein ACI2IX_10175 [Leifsonia aquatica]|uniref:hypothetical protein n=1 Tax=Leifsonia aquatica TaxID=144185 RepID=UPI0038512FD6
MNALEESILLSQLDGEIPLTAIDDFAAQLESDGATRKRLVLEAVRSLLSEGYIVLGQFDKIAEKSQWTDWVGTVDEQVDRLAGAYAPQLDDWESWGFLCWFAHTPKGEEAAEALYADRSR